MCVIKKHQIDANIEEVNAQRLEEIKDRLKLAKKE